MKTIEIITKQQESAMREYKIGYEDMGFQPFPFWEWYARWCEEEGLLNDRTSFQFDSED